jgi:NADH-quinone oxidoreductase subunit N
MPNSRTDILIASLPWIWLGLGAVVCAGLGALRWRGAGKSSRQIAFAACCLAIASGFAEFYRERTSATGVYLTFGASGSRVAPGTFIVDVFSLSVVMAAAFVAVVGLVLMRGSERFHGRSPYACAFMLSAAGFAGYLAAQNEMAATLAALAGLTISLAALMGCLKTDHRALEAALKTVFASVLLAGLTGLGLAVLYGTTGSTHLTDPGSSAVLSALGVTLVICTLAAFTGALPLPQFVTTPTAGVPAAVSGLVVAVLTLGVESAAARIGAGGFARNVAAWPWVVGTMGAVSMVYGGLRAWREPTLRGVIGYLVVVQAGAFFVALMAFGAGSDGLSAGGANLAIAAEFAGTAAIVAAYAALGLLESSGVGGQIDDLKALFSRNGTLATAVLLSIGALAGVPVTFGFLTRALSVTSAGYVNHLWIGVLAIAGMALANMAAFRVFSLLVASPTHESSKLKSGLSPLLHMVTTACAVAAVALIAFAGPLLRLSSAAAGAVFTH